MHKCFFNLKFIVNFNTIYFYLKMNKSLFTYFFTFTAFMATAQPSYTGTLSYSSLPMDGSYIELECNVTVFVKDASTVLLLGHKTNSIRITGVHYHGREIPVSSIPASVIEKIKGNIRVSVSWDLYNSNKLIMRMGHNYRSQVNWAVVQGLPSKESYNTAITESGHKLYNSGAITISNVKIEDAGAWLSGVAEQLSQLSNPARKEPAVATENNTGQKKTTTATANNKSNTGTEVEINGAANTGNGAKSKVGNSSDDDYWGTGNSTAAKKPEGKQAGIPDDAPPMVMDKAGNYYVQNEHGKYVKTDKANYDAVKKDYHTAKNSSATEAYDTQKKQNEQAVLKEFYDGQNDFIDNMKKQQAKSERDGQLMATSYYTAQAKSQAREGLQDLSRLDGSFESLEDLNAAFYQQYSAISDQHQQLTDAGRDKVAANMDYAFKDADANTAAFKGLATGLANLASDAAAEREARQARERLKAERAEQARLIKERKWRTLLAMRTELLKKFPEGGVPLSFHKVPGNDLYFFAYVLAPGALNEEKTTVQVSNVYHVQRHNDGAWPFKNTIVNELKKASGAANNLVMVGYYTDQEQANQMHEAFVNIAMKSDMNILTFNYKGKKSSAAAGGANNDFWSGAAGNKPSQKATPKTNKSNNKSSEDDFWVGENKKPVKHPPEKPSQKKNDDFWE
jgi:hypothetical protein